MTSLLAILLAAGIQAEVLRVIDGDTIIIEAHPWPRMTIETHVRVRGIDAPEIRGKCDAEKEMAQEAKRFVTEWAGEDIEITDVELGSFAGRVIADVWKNGESLAEALLGRGLARPYVEGKGEDWCA